MIDLVRTGQHAQPVFFFLAREVGMPPSWRARYTHMHVIMITHTPAETGADPPVEGRVEEDMVLCHLLLWAGGPPQYPALLLEPGVTALLELQNQQARGH